MRDKSLRISIDHIQHTHASFMIKLYVLENFKVRLQVIAAPFCCGCHPPTPPKKIMHAIK